MAIKQAVYQVDNGTDFDKIHFETSEQMLVDILQSLSETGYRKLPGGLIIQWGRSNARFINSGGAYIAETKVLFPIAFPNERLFAIAAPESYVAHFNAPYRYDGNEEKGATFWFTSRTGTNCPIKWFAIGK